ncbi:DUF3558 domain-containing protein [Speluncibacter jeojiensis]|uniref:DUF3558 domain-containing protein n=1 Tax=Speluncibacter jeojiensis TaxID=2710754 RepID=A0A9X4M4V1_9ACTN|nr:DUF3558 domain-containing protein [Corynebacteriales bacterium D3-21]
MIALATVGMAVTLGGCASPTTGQTATVASVTTAPAPSGPRLTDDSGRPQVLFDPCNDISPAVLVKMSLDPNSKEHSDFEGGTYTFMSCQFKSDMYVLGVSSGNTTAAEQRAEQQRDSATKTVTPVTVAGRAGWMAVDPSRPRICRLTFTTSYGEVMVDRMQLDKAADQGLGVCDGMEQSAEIVASILPPGA